MFFCLEGVDSAGKSTQLQLLANRFKDTEVPLVTSSEFSQSPIGDIIRKTLEQDRFIRFSRPFPTRYSETFLIFSDYALKAEEVIIPALENGSVVISDRYIESLNCYQLQFVCKQYKLPELDFLNHWSDFWCSTFPVLPDVTFLLDISIDECIRRTQKTDGILLEEEEILILKKTIEIYHWLSEKYPTRYIVIDGEQTFEAVTDQLFKYIMGQLFSHYEL